MGMAPLWLAPLLASLALGCSRAEPVPLVLDCSPLPAGLFIVTPPINGAARLIAVDPESGAGLEHAIRETTEVGGAWTAVLLSDRLDQLGIAPGPVELGAGRKYPFDFALKRAVAGEKSVTFSPAADDLLIPELGVAFKDLTSPAFPAPRCRSLVAQELEIDSPPIVTAVTSGFATVFAVGQEIFEPGPTGLRPRLERSGPPVVTTIMRPETGPAVAMPFVPVKRGSPGELAEGFVTASARTKLGHIWYAAVVRTPTVSTTLWAAGGFADAFRPQITIPGVEVRQLAPVDGSPGRVYLLTSRGELLVYREGPGTVETLRTGTSTEGACRISEHELSPSYDCSALSFFDQDASLWGIGPEGQGPVFGIAQDGALEERPLPESERRVLSLIRGPSVLVSDQSAAEVLAVSGAEPQSAYRGPAAYGLSDSTAVGGKIILERSGKVFEILDGQACPVVLTSTVYRRVFTASGFVLLLPPVYAEPGSHRQKVAIIRTPPRP